MPEEQGKSRRPPPPEAHRFKPGQSGNPAGRKASGATIKEWWNSLTLASDATLRRIIARSGAPELKKAAAEAILHTRMARMAHYEKLANGTATLEDLEKAGVDTSLVKKVKERQELDREGNVVSVTREVELHNVAGENLDRIADRTAGKPQQHIDLGGALPQSVTIITPLTRGASDGDPST